ncbi:hypothetical protein EU527_05030 [Candidatus Thorarchaeota archaeon]|nr:MAG: hypothetical protein EU527_05030 [Candidatus Thorarchaeota archaeon]
MEISDRMYNILGLLLVIIALIIQGWMSVFQIVTDDITYVHTSWFSVSIILLMTGSVQLATLNVNRIIAIYHRINYVIAMFGLVGLSVLLGFRVYLESLLFPRTMVVYFLILDLFWIFFLGLLLKRFKTKANTTS